MKIYVTVLPFAVFGASVIAQDLNPVEVLGDLTAAICAPVADINSGSVLKTYFEGEADARLNGALSKFVDLGLQGAGGFDSTEYVNGLASDVLAGEIKSQRDCNLRIYSDFSPRVQDWLLSDSKTATINSDGDCVVNSGGSQNSSSINCTINE